MKRIISLSAFLMIFLFCSMQVQAKVKDVKPAYNLTREYVSVMQILSDTMPRPIKTTEIIVTKPIEQPVASVIKAVPKARKVSVPKPVVVRVKPVKIIKPKIARPILKVL